MPCRGTGILTEKVNGKQINSLIDKKMQGRVEKSYIPSRNEREVNEFRKLNQEKSFDEARSAVQSQIERIFLKE